MVPSTLVSSVLSRRHPIINGRPQLHRITIQINLHGNPSQTPVTSRTWHIHQSLASTNLTRRPVSGTWRKVPVIHGANVVRGANAPLVVRPTSSLDQTGSAGSVWPPNFNTPHYEIPYQYGYVLATHHDHRVTCIAALHCILNQKSLIHPKKTFHITVLHRCHSSTLSK